MELYWVEYKTSHLRKLIETMRKNLIQLSNSRKSFTDPDVVKLSQRLDRLLDEYQELNNTNLKCNYIKIGFNLGDN